MTAPAKTQTRFLQELRKLVCDSHDAVRIEKTCPGGMAPLKAITKLSDDLDNLYERWAKADGDPL